MEGVNGEYKVGEIPTTLLLCICLCFYFSHSDENEIIFIFIAADSNLFKKKKGFSWLLPEAHISIDLFTIFGTLYHLRNSSIDLFASICSSIHLIQPMKMALLFHFLRPKDSLDS